MLRDFEVNGHLIAGIRIQSASTDGKLIWIGT